MLSYNCQSSTVRSEKDGTLKDWLRYIAKNPNSPEVHTSLVGWSGFRLSNERKDLLKSVAADTVLKIKSTEKAGSTQKDKEHCEDLLTCIFKKLGVAMQGMEYDSKRNYTSCPEVKAYMIFAPDICNAFFAEEGDPSTTKLADDSMDLSTVMQNTGLVKDQRDHKDAQSAGCSGPEGSAASSVTVTVAQALSNKDFVETSGSTKGNEPEGKAASSILFPGTDTPKYKEDLKDTSSTKPRIFLDPESCATTSPSTR